MTRIATTTLVLLSAAAIVALSAMVHGAGKFEWNWFYPWVIGPYVVLLLLFCLPVRQSKARSLAGCISAVLLLVFTCFAYINAMWFSVSSTSALVFIFAPAYLFVGGLMGWAVAWLLISLGGARRDGEGTRR
jgi:hypothetical protein